jgi:hypothetical protein
MLAGDFTAPEQWLRDVTERVSRLEHWWGLGFEIRASIALVLCEQERYEEAVRLTDVMPTEVGDNAEGHVLWRRGRARALARLGQTDEATVSHAMPLTWRSRPTASTCEATRCSIVPTCYASAHVKTRPPATSTRRSHSTSARATSSWPSGRGG